MPIWYTRNRINLTLLQGKKTIPKYNGWYETAAYRQVQMFLNQVLAVLSIKTKPSRVTLRFFPTHALFCLQALFSGILLAIKFYIIRLQ